MWGGQVFRVMQILTCGMMLLLWTGVAESMKQFYIWKMIRGGKSYYLVNELFHQIIESILTNTQTSLFISVAVPSYLKENLL